MRKGYDFSKATKNPYVKRNKAAKLLIWAVFLLIAVGLIVYGIMLGQNQETLF